MVLVNTFFKKEEKNKKKFIHFFAPNKKKAFSLTPMTTIQEKISKIALLSSDCVPLWSFSSEGKKEGSDIEEGTAHYFNPYVKIGKAIKFKDWYFYIENSHWGSFIYASDGKTIRYNLNLMNIQNDEDEFFSFIKEKVIPLFD